MRGCSDSEKELKYAISGKCREERDYLCDRKYALFDINEDSNTISAQSDVETNDRVNRYRRIYKPENSIGIIAYVWYHVVMERQPSEAFPFAISNLLIICYTIAMKGR